MVPDPSWRYVPTCGCCCVALGEGFFAESARYNSEQLANQVDGNGDSQSVSVPIPDGWEARAIVSQLIAAGMCSYTDIATNKITMRDLFRMMHLRDWNNYAQDYAYNVKKMEQ